MKIPPVPLPFFATCWVTGMTPDEAITCATRLDPSFGATIPLPVLRLTIEHYFTHLDERLKQKEDVSWMS